MNIDVPSGIPSQPEHQDVGALLSSLQVVGIGFRGPTEERVGHIQHVWVSLLEIQDLVGDSQVGQQHGIRGPEADGEPVVQLRLVEPLGELLPVPDIVVVVGHARDQGRIEVKHHDQQAEYCHAPGGNWETDGRDPGQGCRGERNRSQKSKYYRYLKVVVHRCVNADPDYREQGSLFEEQRR